LNTTHGSFVKVCLTVSVYATEFSINHARLTSVMQCVYDPELALLLSLLYLLCSVLQ